ncbi:outer membrane protein transport protein [candidate division KSB1 bacterium]|nr:outer membrane protein transport protein [candidate division KSB1 bacterium]
MRRILFVLTLVFSVVIAAPNLFSAGIDLTGVGARATALGGSFRAVADDWSAVHWNPAGMVFTNGLTAGFSTEFISVKAGYTPAKIGDQLFSATSGEEVNNEAKTFFVPSGGLYHSNGKYAVGLGVWAPFGLGAKWDILNTDDYNAKYPEFDYDDDMQVINIQPTFAYKVSDKFSVGLGVSFVSATITIEKPNYTPNPYVFSPTVTAILNDPANAALKAGLQQAGAFDAIYNHLLTDTNLEGDGTGFGANFGIMYKATENLTIGANLQYFSTIGLDGTVDATTYFADNSAVNGVITQYLKPALDLMHAAGQLSDAEYSTLLYYYSGGTLARSNNQAVKADMPLPMRAGIGVSYTGIKNLLISADVAWTQWSVWDVIDINDENGNKVSELVENWEDGIRAGIGLEYSLSMLKLRGSFYTEPNAAIPETMSPSIPDFSRRNVVNVGVQVPLGPVYLSASYEKILVGDLDVDTWQPTPDFLGYENLAGIYSLGINNFMFGLDYNF